MANRTKPNKVRTRDSDCCSVNFVKYVLHIFNIIFFMSGIGVAAIAVWTIVCKHQYVSLLVTSNYVIGTYALLAAGVLAVIGGFVGCCGVWREQRALILCYTFLLLVVFLLEAIVGGLAYVYEFNIGDELRNTLNDTFLSGYGRNERQTLAIDQMQQSYICCGAIRFEDWRRSDWTRMNETDSLRPNQHRIVPDSCCLSMSDGCGKRDHPSNIPYTGCVYKFTDEMRDHLNILAAVGSGICVVQLFGLVLSCCLYIKLKNITDALLHKTPKDSPGDFFADDPSADGVSLIYGHESHRFDTRAEICPVHQNVAQAQQRSSSSEPVASNGNGRHRQVHYAPDTIDHSNIDGIYPMDVSL